ncbi:F-box protein at5g46170 [Phtheirospermum japonicum]|uniref:F-box protein at5g46170 n=1 Tax=Phtheirospermum japonicum TaxID=374723 RepID=A0A830CBY1_9LAMI|nr:F-box protein at5g46170 [Phtheirospermum japonicum]
MEFMLGFNKHLQDDIVEDKSQLQAGSVDKQGRVKVHQRISFFFSPICCLCSPKTAVRHYLLQPIIVKHEMLESLVLTDADGRGVLFMNREQLEELRFLNGVVLKEATLVAIRPTEQPKKEVVGPEGNCVVSAFEEPLERL